MSDKSRASRVVKHIKSVVTVKPIEIELDNGDVFELEDLTGRKITRIVKEVGDELIGLSKHFKADMQPVEMARVAMEVLDDETLDRLVNVLFDGYPVLDMRIADLFELVESYANEIDIESVFSVWTRLKLIINGTKVIQAMRDEMEAARLERLNQVQDKTE